MSSFSRRQFLAASGAAGTAALAGCSTAGTLGGGNGDDGGGDDGGDTTVQEGVPIADATLPLPSSPAEIRSEAQSGGPSKDGIPSIDDPSFVDAGAASFLDDGDPVFGYARDGVVKAYPQKILAQHEIVNDTLGDLPVAVTYCPLTGTVLGFERGTTTFGVSGRLINNNLVMYDRASETWWPQILATAIPGPWNENPETTSLREVSLVWTTWGRWRERYPGTRVLSRDTGFARNYSNDPYGSYNPVRGYYEGSSTLFPRLNPDDTYHSKEVFLGARTAEGAAAFRKSSLADAKLLTGDLGGTPALAVYDPGLDTGYVYLNPDGTAVDYDGERVTLDGTAHDPDSLPLSRVHTFDAMWFAWSGYYPDSTVYE